MLSDTMQIYQDMAEHVYYTALLHFLKSHLFAVKTPYYVTVLQFLNHTEQYSLVI